MKANTGMIVGIVIGAVVAVGLVGAVAGFFGYKAYTKNGKLIFFIFVSF